MTIVLDLDKTNSLIDEAVAARGDDFVYQKNARNGCVYVTHDDAGNAFPSCLVGDVLHRAGVPLEVLEPFDTYEDGDSTGANVVLLELKSEGVLTFDDQSLTLLDWAQVQQDGGEPWGRAVEIARNEVAKLLAEEDAA